MTERLGLEGGRGLVVAGTSEIAGACIRRLCDEGMTIWFAGGDRGRGETIAAGTGATFLECDRRDRASTDRAVERALGLAGGRLDVLVTGSEAIPEGSIEATSDDGFRELVEMSLTSVFRIARACAGPMRAGGGGSMIHISSDSGIRAAHETAVHSVTSAGVIALAELFAAEGAPYGIRSNAVCPGIGAPRTSDRVATGSDVAALVAWLACDEAAHMSGATLRLDAGAGAAMVIETRG